MRGPAIGRAAAQRITMGSARRAAPVKQWIDGFFQIWTYESHGGKQLGRWGQGSNWELMVDLASIDHRDSNRRR
jgi:hypothetical protein